MLREFDCDLTDDRKINKYKLDEAWEEQAELSYKWGRKYAEAAKRRDILQLEIETIMKAELDLLKAEIDTELRADFTSSGMKVTENQISSGITQDDKYQKKLKEIQNKKYDLIDAEEEVKIFDAAKWSMQDRKKSLEYESELWLSGYYGDPKQPGEIRTKEQLRERMKTRREGGQ